ncbi:MAG: hypothetical protein JNM07_07625 [Phycisphaerae bacterium]|nr:hypothetical protein [Phycisphaerae bacterium]
MERRSRPSRSFRALAASASLVAAATGTTAARADFSFPDFSSTADLGLYGAATENQNRLRLTGAEVSNQFGGAFVRQSERLRDGFRTSFQFRISDPRGPADADGRVGGDGLALVVLGDDSNLGILAQRRAIGYDGLRGALVVEFDTRRDPDQSDPPGCHISVHIAGANGAASVSEHTSIALSSFDDDFNDDRPHTVIIDYTPGTLSVYFDRADQPVVTVELDLESTVELRDGKAFVGLVASTSDSRQNHDILTWSLTGTQGGRAVAFAVFAAIRSPGVYADRAAEYSLPLPQIESPGSSGRAAPVTQDVQAPNSSSSRGIDPPRDPNATTGTPAVPDKPDAGSTSLPPGELPPPELPPIDPPAAPPTSEPPPVVPSPIGAPALGALATWTALRRRRGPID